MSDDRKNDSHPIVPAVTGGETPGGVDRFRRDAGRLGAGFDAFQPMVPEPEVPANSLARIYSSWSKNEIEWRVYKQQYTAMAEKQAELLKERANHIIAKAKMIHEREQEQLREVLKMHNSEVISGLQLSAHEITQTRLLEIAEEYMKQIQKIAQFPQEIREVLHQDAARVWDHSRRKVLKYALEHTGSEPAENRD